MQYNKERLWEKGRTAMRISGSSRKDGMTLYSDQYAVILTYDKKLGEYSYGLRSMNEDTKAGEKIKNIPVFRGLYALWRNPGIKAAAAVSAAGVAGEMLVQSAPDHKGIRRLGRVLSFAEYGLMGLFLYKIFGTGGDVRKFHGAEHKVINAFTLTEKKITEQEAARASRISRRCGTNYLVYVTAANLTVGLLPLGHGIFQQLITMGAAYEGFRMPAEKCPAIKSTMDLFGDALQRKVMTREPDKGQLQAARRALNILIAAEKGELSEEERQQYLANARERSWLDRLVG